MNRPSRRLRESATTTLKKGRFLAPPRASRITTIALPRVKKDVDYKAERRLVARYCAVAISSSSAQAWKSPLQPAQHLLPASAADHLHHLPRLFELAEQPVDLLHRHAGASSDAALARSLQQFRFCALFRRHRVDDAFEPPNAAL